MYSRYSPQMDDSYIPAAQNPGFAEQEKSHARSERGNDKQAFSPFSGLSNLFGGFGGGKNPLGGFLKGLRRRDGGDLDISDIVLILILLLLFMEDGNTDIFIILAIILILGI